MLTTRKIGKFYYVRGTVRVGKQTFKIKEHSTGFTKAKDVNGYIVKLTGDITDSVMNPQKDKSSKVLFDECAKNYIQKHKLKIGEMAKISILLPHFQEYAVSDIQTAWDKFLKKKGHLSAGYLNRCSGIINRILKFSSDDLGYSFKAIKKFKNEKPQPFILTDDVKNKLLSCFSKHAKPIFTVLAYQGLREQECLQLLWEDIHFKDRVIVIRKSKNGESRTSPMNKKVWFVLAREYIRQKRPNSGHVWLTTKNKPYTDTRALAGGSPIRKAQILALMRLKRIYGIDLKMRVHDWRHTWASSLVMAGVDILTVQRLGGWKSLEMVKRYATISTEHEIQAINKI